MDPEKRAPEFHALHIPPEALENGGLEVVRAVIVEGDLHISLRRAFDEPDSWGLLLADLSRHIARLFAAESSLTEEQALARVRAIYEAEMESPTDPGTTRAIG